MEAANFQIDSDERPGEARVSVSGELDLSAAPRLARAADKVLEGGPRRLLLDLSGLRFIDSSGLRTIIVLHQRASQEGWALEVVRPPKHLMTIFQISGMDDHLHFVEGQGRDVAR